MCALRVQNTDDMVIGPYWLSDDQPGDRFGLTGNNDRHVPQSRADDTWSAASRVWETGVGNVLVGTDGWAGAEQVDGPATEDRSAPLRLTAREIDVLRMIGEGQSVSGIAETLSYSESTIKKVIHVAMRQIGAKNRTHAVAIAVRAKVI